MASEKHVPKNIVVCADGTGNKGGSSPDSNVYRVYKMINKHFSDKCQDGVKIKEQILFYDNGVGTEKNNFIRAITAGVGLGFKHNVCDLYKFIARNYKEGDRIYFFGFSRGASTVRACNGMISKCGLVKCEDLGNAALQEKVDAAYEVYVNHQRYVTVAKNFREDTDNSWGAVQIQFLGVWDTVVALGFPKRTDLTGPVTKLLNFTFNCLEVFFNFFFPHKFYHYKLTNNVKYACQALAIDDERTAFWPYVWNEINIGGGAENRTSDNVNQVWFSGMHANVGGGYERDGIAMIPLLWLMKQAEDNGLVFNSDAVRIVQDTRHVHGRMYNTRLGLKMIYRYHPRKIETLCKTDAGKSILLGEIKIHSSVIERMEHRTANYIPNYIPGKFDIVESDTYKNTIAPEKSSDWSSLRKRLDDVVLWRKKLYGISLAVFFLFTGITVYLWNCPSDSNSTINDKDGFFIGLSKLLDYFTPDMFDGLINVVIIKNPLVIVGVVIYLVGYYYVRRYFFEQTVIVGESIRRVVMSSLLKDK